MDVLEDEYYCHRGGGGGGPCLRTSDCRLRLSHVFHRSSIFYRV